MALIPTALLLLACGEQDGSDDTGAAASTEQRPAPAYSLETCPLLEDGGQAFPTGDSSYDVRLYLPPDPQGAPVIFAWHWLGGTAAGIARTLGLDDLAEEQGVVVIAPESDGSPYEWHFLDDPQDNPDLLLFEDLLACAHDQWAVDLDRIFTTGMSAGGLQATYLTMHRAEWLAASAPLSGGIIEGFYATPAWPLPVLLTWGGPSDESNGLSFHDAALLFSQELQDDGSFVIECEHDLGHDIPDEAGAYVWRFFQDHPMSAVEEPYSSGLPGEFPSWCRVP